MGSERSFGIVFAIVFAIIAFWPLVFHGNAVRFWSLAVAVGFLAVAFLAPGWLKPLNTVWFKFGLLLSKIMAPLVMSLIFVLTVIPIGYIRRMKNPDPLNQAFDADAESYWIIRDPSAEHTMRKQF
jgi:hypothetical protein